MKSKYAYKGSVTSFGKWIGSFEGETTAETASKAKSNLIYQFKKKYGMGETYRVELPDPVREVATY